jgi:hypothetical protein
MPFVKVPESELVVGEEYVITHIGCKSKAGNNGTTFVHGKKTMPYSGSTYNAVVEACERVETPPGSVVALERAYKTWKRINPPHTGYDWRRSPSIPRVDHGVQESEYRKRAFFAGMNESGVPVFTQDRPFGSKKAVAFEPVDVSKKRAVAGNWVAWQEAGAAASVGRNNNAATRRNNVAANVPTGNLLGLNNKPRMSNGNNATRKGRENWYKQHAREQELKNLFGGRRRTARRRRARTI